MNNFSISTNSQVDIVDQYTDFLSRELNSKWCINEDDFNNPLLLQQLGVLRATRIQKAVETNGTILYQGLHYTNDTIRTSSNQLARKIGEVAPMITSHLDKGFTAMHHSLCTINKSVLQTNQHLEGINSTLGIINENAIQTNQHIKRLTTATMQGFKALHQEQQVTNQHLKVANHNLQNIEHSILSIGGTIGQGFSMLQARLNATNTLLQSVLEELRIPETQRERRYHIEEGTKYLAMALSENDKFYYEDAIAEFREAIKLERKDFYSWFNLGFIYLRSIYHIDIQKSVDAFERFVHYARAEAVQRNNQSLKFKLDEAYLLMAEAKYLLQNPSEAIQLTELCFSNKKKALFMKVKYLSFIGDMYSKRLAADILEDLLNENPFLSLQVLEDADIISNECVVNLLYQLKQETIDYAKKQLQYWEPKVKDLLGRRSHMCLKQITQCMALIGKNTYLDAYEAIYLLNGFDKINYTVNGVNFKMVAIEGGTFTMGKTKDQGGVDSPSIVDTGDFIKHKVTLSDFFIGETVVTIELWKAVMNYIPQYQEKDFQCPIICRWSDCQLFIKTINRITGEKFRLLTESEWEYAAREGRKTNGYRYAGSNTLNDVGWYKENSPTITTSDGRSGVPYHPVMQKQPNELGLYDMSGCVMEWCNDWYGPYHREHQINPMGPLSGKSRITRGGDRYDDEKKCRVSARSSMDPNSTYSIAGFRLALSK